MLDLIGITEVVMLSASPRQAILDFPMSRYGAEVFFDSHGL
jgi:hypothetical protein